MNGRNTTSGSSPHTLTHPRVCQCVTDSRGGGGREGGDSGLFSSQVQWAGSLGRQRTRATTHCHRISSHTVSLASQNYFISFIHSFPTRKKKKFKLFFGGKITTTKNEWKLKFALTHSEFTLKLKWIKLIDGLCDVISDDYSCKNLYKNTSNCFDNGGQLASPAAALVFAGEEKVPMIYLLFSRSNAIWALIYRRFLCRATQIDDFLERKKNYSFA